MRTFVYIDGYNLYFGLRNLCEARGRSWRWLDIQKLCEAYTPSDYVIERIRYFTANIRPGGKPKALRQQEFLRALRTLAAVSIHYGRYEIYPAEYPLAEGSDRGKYVKVNKIEEKRTDVNLASMLLLDALVADESERAEAVVVVSNDSDLAFPIKELKRRGLPIGIINPHPSRPSAELKEAATFYRDVRVGKVFQARFPREMADRRGTFACPERWAVDEW